MTKPDATTDAYSWEVWICNGITIIGIVIFLLGIAVFGYQGFLWLRYGEWTPLEFRLAWQAVGGLEPSLWHKAPWSWGGVQKIALAILDAPLSLGILVIGIAVFFGGNAAAESIRDGKL